MPSRHSYSKTAMELAMKIQEVILRAQAKTITRCVLLDNFRPGYQHLRNILGVGWIKVALPLGLVGCRVLMVEATLTGRGSTCSGGWHWQNLAFALRRITPWQLVWFPEKYRTQPGLARWLSANAFRGLELALSFTLRGGLGSGPAHPSTTTDGVS
jgi:hypothetical protein